MDSSAGHSVASLATAIRDGSLDSQAVTERVLAADLSGYLNLASHNRPRHVSRCRGMLAGVPVSVKDLYAVEGLPCFAGTGRELPPAWQHEGSLLARLRRQGASIIGTTHTGELALGGLGVNHHWGTPVNPWDPGRVAGGSSSGAALTIAYGAAMLALGTDTGGSVRVPASMTAAVGFKPTWGVLPLDGVVPLAAMYDSAGLIARSVADVACGYAALCTADDCTAAITTEVPLHGLRLALAEPLFEGCDPGIAETVEDALRQLTVHGAALHAIAFDEAGQALRLTRDYSFVAAECSNFVNIELPGWQSSLGPLTRQTLVEGAALADAEVLVRQRRFAALLSSGCASLTNNDLIISPTVAITAPRLPQLAKPNRYRELNSMALRNTVVVNLLGLCALSLPVGFDRAGIPVGLQLIAAAHAEPLLLGAARSIERVLGVGGPGGCGY